MEKFFDMRYNMDNKELTNIGSFGKCWRLKDGVWWLYKQADALELFSEYFICLLGKRFGFDMAEYIPCSDYVRPKTRAIKTRDFTDGAGVNFEPLDAIMGEDVAEPITFSNDSGKISQAIHCAYGGTLRKSESAQLRPRPPAGCGYRHGIPPCAEF